MLPGLGLVLWLVSGFSTGRTYGAHTTAFVKTHSAHILQLRVFSCVNQNSLWVNKDLLYCTLFSLNYSNHLLLINVTLMNVRLIQVIKYSSDSPKDTQPHKPDHWYEQWNVFIYPGTFLLVSKLWSVLMLTGTFNTVEKFKSHPTFFIQSFLGRLHV